MSYVSLFELNNTTHIPLGAGETFQGLLTKVEVGKYIHISANSNSPVASDIEFEVYQRDNSRNNTNEKLETFTYAEHFSSAGGLIHNPNQVISVPIVASYVCIKVTNTNGTTALTDLAVVSTILDERTHNINTRKLNKDVDIVSLAAFDLASGVQQKVQCDTNGRLLTNTEVTIDSMTPEDDGIRIYGSVDGATTTGSLKLIKTTTDGTTLVSDNFINGDVVSSEIVASSTDFAIGTDISATIDLGSGNTRMTNICFSGQVGLATNTDPKVIMAFSDNGNDFFYDGVYANFYKQSALTWYFNFQRDNISQRYVKLVADKAVTILKCRQTQSKK